MSKLKQQNRLNRNLLLHLLIPINRDILDTRNKIQTLTDRINILEYQNRELKKMNVHPDIKRNIKTYLRNPSDPQYDRARLINKLYLLETKANSIQSKLKNT